jgi:hypothetical protein
MRPNPSLSTDPLRQAVLPVRRLGLSCTARASRPASAVGVSSNVRPHMPPRPRPSARDLCPCCGFPTLGGRAFFEVCSLCNWEDDGQDDHNADEVLGGPNADYSLSEARKNFRERGHMYRAGGDRRFLGGDTPEESKVKADLVAIFTAWKRGTAPTQEEADNVLRLERRLHMSLSHRIMAHEARLRGEA